MQTDVRQGQILGGVVVEIPPVGQKRAHGIGAMAELR
jgi:hypothetical protein